MATQTMQDLLLQHLADMYDAEQQFLQGQEQMLAHATNMELQNGLQTHIDQTRGHIQNLEQVFNLLGTQPQRQTCQIAAALVQEAQQEISEAGTPSLRDIVIDSAADKVEHFEIASYNGLIGGAQGMGQQQIVQLLQQNLQQEQQTAQTLEQLAPQLLQTALQEEGTAGKGSATAGATMQTAGATASATMQSMGTTGIGRTGGLSGDQDVIVDTSGAQDILIDDTGTGNTTRS